MLRQVQLRKNDLTKPGGCVADYLLMKKKKYAGDSVGAECQLSHNHGQSAK